VITESAIAETTGPRVLAKMLDERISGAERPGSVPVIVPSAMTSVMSSFVAGLVAAVRIVMRMTRFLGVFPPNICRMHVVFLSNSSGYEDRRRGFFLQALGSDDLRALQDKRGLEATHFSPMKLTRVSVLSNVRGALKIQHPTMKLTFAQKMRLKASALRAAAMNRAVHAAARVRYAMPDAHPKKHGVAVLRNVVYGPTSSPAHKLDVYVPLLMSKPRPIVMYVHGGGFSMLSKDTHRVMAMAFARRGYIVFNINYRLGQKNAFPAPLDDCAEALVWVHRHAAEYGGDPNRLVLAGESAGGNLVAALALACASRLDTPFLKRVYDANISPVATIATYPFADVTTFLRVQDHPRVPRWAKHMTFDAAASYVGAHVYDVSQISQLASPLLMMEAMASESRTTARPLSPFFLAVGTKDPLIEDSRRMKRALDDLGVECELHISPGEIHGFDAMVWRPEARRKWKRVHEFLARHASNKRIATPHVPRVKAEGAT
jgi:acetyl esterase